MSRTAVVVYNLGGPDSPEAVRPFLKNLFSDPMIIRLPGPLRWLVATMISRRRAPVAREIYAQIGGRSPILPETEIQADALQAALGDGYRVFIAMRYWHPFADQVARDVADWTPARVVLLPLYPQFSTTTTESFLRIWKPAAEAAGLTAPSTEICCYPEEPGFISAVARTVDVAIAKIPDGAPFRVLAEEQAALAEIAMGDNDAALARLQGLMDDADAGRALRDRAAQLIVALGGTAE